MSESWLHDVKMVRRFKPNIKFVFNDYTDY